MHPMSKAVRADGATPVDWQISNRSITSQTARIRTARDTDMETDFYTLGVVAMVLMCGWLMNHAGPWSNSDLARELRLQLGRSADAIGGAPHR